MDKTERLINWKEDERKDQNRDGIDDELEPTIPDVSAGSKKLRQRLRDHTDTNPTLSGGDIDARWEDADSSGEESVAGSAPTPGQDNVQEIGEAVGVTYQDNEELKVGEKERSRDQKRWELDPASSDDYQDRLRDRDR
ncbi:MAG TPA: DUF6335 family protein [Thermoanaerobaculia bacterium]|nr:DUF6335 family protein [Thermoanaerobaculia bacterium]